MSGAVNKVTPEEDIYQINKSKADIIKNNKDPGNFASSNSVQETRRKNTIICKTTAAKLN